jgi:adenosine deaminase CECR1
MRKILRFVALLGLTSAVPAADFSARFEEIKHAAPAELYTFLYAMPKGGDLHNHLGGAIRAEWWYAVATDPARNGGDVFYTRVKFSATTLDTGASLVLFRTIRRFTFSQLSVAEQADYARLDQLTPEQKQAWLDSLRLDRPGEGRDEFFNWIWPRTGQLHQNLNVIAETLVETMKAYGAEGLRYLETQQSAAGFTDNDGNPIPVETAANFLRARLTQPDAVATGVTVRFQTTVFRFAPYAEKQLEEFYQFVDGHRDLWVGINMAGIEENGKGYASRFLQKFRELRRQYPTLPLSIHAGEMDGPDHHIRDTLLLGASRIGHGVNLIQDPDTLLLMRNNKYLVEINLISNRLLEYTPDLSKHPFPEYLRTGVPVCLNTDDRGMWDSNMTDEYYTAVTTFNLSWDEILQLGRNSLAYSFVQPDVKAKLLAAYERDMAAFAAKYLPADSLGQLTSVKPVTYGYAKRNWGFPFAQ